MSSKLTAKRPAVEAAKSQRLHSTSTPNRDIFDPNGDLLLILTHTEGLGIFGPPTEQESEILVSSTVLRLASPVIARMLASNFAEGQLFKDSAEKGEFARVRLPDDDLFGMQLFCRIAHHHVLGQTEEDALTTQDIGAFFLVCHKYGCLNRLSFKSAAERWMSAPVRQQKSDRDKDALVIAYVLDNPCLFDDISKELIVPAVGPFKANRSITTGLGPFSLPHEVISALNDKRKALLDQVFYGLQSIGEALQPHNEGPNGTFYYAHTSSASTDCHERLIGAWSSRILDIARQEYSLGRILSGLSQFRMPKIKNPCDHPLHTCRNFDVRAKVKDLCLQIQNRCCGLCFNCIKSDAGACSRHNPETTSFHMFDSRPGTPVLSPLSRRAQSEE